MLAIEAAYRQYMGVLRRRAQKILKAADVAEDIAHEAFIRFMREVREGREVKDVGALLFTMVTRLALNHVRDNKAHTRLIDENVTPFLVQAVVSSGAASWEHRMDFKRVLQSLPEDEVEIALYYHFDGMSQDEIAEVLGIGRRMVGRRLEAFARKARRLLAAPTELSSGGGDRRRVGSAVTPTAPLEVS